MLNFSDNIGLFINQSINHKGSSSDDRDSSSENNDDLSTSTILTARFGHESVKVIHLVEKNLYIVIG
jgi:hypothetical protein